VHFRTTIIQTGKTACGMKVPHGIVDALGRGRRPPVTVTIKGHSYRSTVAVYGDEYWLGVSAENRAAAGVVAGDMVDVDVELDTATREVTVPPDLAAALDAHPAARAAFDALSYSRKQFFVLPIEAAKAPETRARRVDKTIAALELGTPEG
jgi:hypothetical protein